MWDRQPLTKVFTLATLLVRTESSQGHSWVKGFRNLFVILLSFSRDQYIVLSRGHRASSGGSDFNCSLLLILISSGCRCCFKCVLVCFIWSELSLQAMIWILQTCWTNWTLKAFYLFCFSVVFLLVAWALASMGVRTRVHMSFETQNLGQVSFLDLSSSLTLKLIDLARLVSQWASGTTCPPQAWACSSTLSSLAFSQGLWGPEGSNAFEFLFQVILSKMPLCSFA